MTRSLPEWIGRSDDSRVPDRVRDRLFTKFDGKCQCGCWRKIRVGESWDLDHIEALINGGEHREANLQPVLREHHKMKTAEDVRIKGATARRRQKHRGIRSSRSPIAGWRKFDGTPVRNPKLQQRRSSNG